MKTYVLGDLPVGSNPLEKQRIDSKMNLNHSKYLYYDSQFPVKKWELRIKDYKGIKKYLNEKIYQVNREVHPDAVFPKFKSDLRITHLKRLYKIKYFYEYLSMWYGYLPVYKFDSKLDICSDSHIFWPQIEKLDNLLINFPVFINFESIEKFLLTKLKEKKRKRDKFRRGDLFI